MGTSVVRDQGPPRAWREMGQAPVNFEGTERDGEEGSEGILPSGPESMASGHQTHDRLGLEHQEAPCAQRGS